MEKYPLKNVWLYLTELGIKTKFGDFRRNQERNFKTKHLDPIGPARISVILNNAARSGIAVPKKPLKDILENIAVAGDCTQLDISEFIGSAVDDIGDYPSQSENFEKFGENLVCIEDEKVIRSLALNSNNWGSLNKLGKYLGMSSRQVFDFIRYKIKSGVWLEGREFIVITHKTRSRESGRPVKEYIAEPFAMWTMASQASTDRARQVQRLIKEIIAGDTNKHQDISSSAEEMHRAIADLAKVVASSSRIAKEEVEIVRQDANLASKRSKKAHSEVKKVKQEIENAKRRETYLLKNVLIRNRAVSQEYLVENRFVPGFGLSRKAQLAQILRKVGHPFTKPLKYCSGSVTDAQLVNEFPKKSGLLASFTKFRNDIEIVKETSKKFRFTSEYLPSFEMTIEVLKTEGGSTFWQKVFNNNPKYKNPYDSSIQDLGLEEYMDI